MDSGYRTEQYTLEQFHHHRKFFRKNFSKVIITTTGQKKEKKKKRGRANKSILEVKRNHLKIQLM